jgi:hypothetical protein
VAINNAGVQNSYFAICKLVIARSRFSRAVAAIEKENFRYVFSPFDDRLGFFRIYPDGNTIKKNFVFFNLVC